MSFRFFMYRCMCAKQLVNLVKKLKDHFVHVRNKSTFHSLSNRINKSKSATWKRVQRHFPNRLNWFPCHVPNKAQVSRTLSRNIDSQTKTQFMFVTYINWFISIIPIFQWLIDFMRCHSNQQEEQQIRHNFAFFVIHPQNRYLSNYLNNSEQ